MQQVNVLERHGPRVVSSRHSRSLAEFRRLARDSASQTQRVLLEGLHLLREARHAGLVVHRAAFTPAALASTESGAEARSLLAVGVDVMEVSERLMATVSPVRSSSGVLAIAEYRPTALEDVFHGSPALVIIAAEIQDPGNVGALIRAADAGGATGVVVAGASASPYAWKALRGSMGSAFRMPVATRVAATDAVRAARDHGLQILATAPHEGRDPALLDLNLPTAFLLGNEGTGLAGRVAALADQVVSIPMRSPVESLNVAVAAALLVYETFRQRAGHPRS